MVVRPSTSEGKSVLLLASKVTVRVNIAALTTLGLIAYTVQGVSRRDSWNSQLYTRQSPLHMLQSDHV